jgi:hypothetical protein
MIFKILELTMNKNIENMHTNQDINYVKILRLLLGRFRLILAICILFLSATSLYFFLSPSTYKATVSFVPGQIQRIDFNTSALVTNYIQEPELLIRNAPKILYEDKEFTQKCTQDVVPIQKNLVLRIINLPPTIIEYSFVSNSEPVAIECAREVFDSLKRNELKSTESVRNMTPISPYPKPKGINPSSTGHNNVNYNYLIQTTDYFNEKNQMMVVGTLSVEKLPDLSRVGKVILLSGFIGLVLGIFLALRKEIYQKIVYALFND